MGKIGYLRLCRIFLAFALIFALAPQFSSASETTPPESMTLPAAQTITYDRQAAVTWAQQNNYNDGESRGSCYTCTKEGRDCTTYVARALSAGGFNPPGWNTNWDGNNDLTEWMTAHPEYWEFRPLGQLEPGDFVLLSTTAWMNETNYYIFDGGSWAWSHSALVIAPGPRLAAWNAEHYDVPVDWFYTMPARVGVHIRDGNSTEVDYEHQGNLIYGVKQTRTPNGSEHRWRLSASSSHAPLLFDLERAGGDLTYRMILKNSSGQFLVDTHSSIDGRGIVTLENVPTGDYYLHIIPDAGKTGSYSITAWANSIPMIRYEWGDQSSYSNVRRWQAPVGSAAQDFYIVFERMAGDLEINWQLKTRGGTLLNSGSSVNGRVIAPANASGWVDFYITSVTGDGSYRIGLRQGIPITLGLRATTATTPVEVGTTVVVEILLDAPQTAPGGGVYALENVCTVSPAGMLDGQTVTAGTLFQPDPVTINQGFQADDSHTYATSQSGSNPPISASGVVYTLTFSAIGAGEATLDCDSQMIDANGVQGPLPFTGVKITVQQPPPTTGIVAGSVGRSHATDAGITVTLLDSNQNVVATATTQNDGTFLMPDIPAGTYVIRASTLGHLPAQGNVTVVAGQTAQMQAVVLPAGEIITAGNVIDELDVVQLAINYGKSVPPADAAADFDLSGSINLTDLRALAQHLRMTGPISWGQ